MEEEIRQLERKLKQALSEQEHLREHNTYLTSELDRFVHLHFINLKTSPMPVELLKCLASSHMCVHTCMYCHMQSRFRICCI